MPPPSASDATPGVIRLRPIRSLVLGSDLAYRAHVLAVIDDLGPIVFADISVAEGDDLADLLELVRRERPDVVVLDATGRETGVARVIHGLADASCAVGVVVVCEHSTAAARQLGALPKWGWTQDMRRAVECAYIDGTPRLSRPAGPLAGWAEKGPPAPG